MPDRFKARLFSRVRILPLLLFVLTALAGLAACDATTSPTPIPTIDPVAEALGQIPNATAMTMRDDWAGLSPANPILAHYILERKPEGMTGMAEFQAGEGRGVTVSETVPINIPESVIKDFLARLAAIPLVEGAYNPKVEHTDDYPNISINLQITNGTAAFYTQSQGAEHIPWGISLANKTYVVDSPAIWEAYQLLLPYLKKDELDKVVEEASSR